MAGIFVGQVGIFPELPMATGGKTKDIDVTAIDETGFWDCEQLALRTSGGEGQRTGGVGDFEFRISECVPATLSLGKPC